MTKKRRISVAGWATLVAMQAGMAQMQAQQGNEVFRIGTFDHSSVEFPQAKPKSPVNFVVGESSAKDWYATQPVEMLPAGPQKDEPAKAPRTITFSLPQTPVDAYLLHISVLFESACVPALRIGIDGKNGVFYLRPVLDFNNGDQESSFDVGYSHAEVKFAIPASYLHQGKNTITLQAIKKATEIDPEASLTYDALELSRDTAKIPPSSADVASTIFFEKHGDALNENVDVFVRHNKPFKQGSDIELTLDGKQYRQSAPDDTDFGEERLTFAVSEFGKNTLAHVQWDEADGQRGHEDRRIDPGKKWTVFLVPHLHVDVGYTDYQAKVAAIQAQTIDEAMDVTVKHPDFRFSLDGEWDLEQFLQTRTAADQQRAVKAIQDRQIYVPAQYANLLTGFPTAETLIRSLYQSANFSRIHGTPFNYANITDVPSYSWSYASILAAAGIHSLVGGSNNYRAPVLLQGHLNENSPFWWEGPDGGKVLLWYSRHYMQMTMVFGRPRNLLDAGHDKLPLFLQQYKRPEYSANAAIMYGSQVENTDLYPQQAELAGEWNSKYAYPQLQYSGFYDALQNIAAQLGPNIPTIHGDGGPYWEDGIASDAYYAAMERWNEPRALTAEKLDTLSTLVNPRLAANTAKLNSMWTNMELMDEHTWASYQSISDPTSTEAVEELEVKDQNAVSARDTADFVVKVGMSNLAQSIQGEPGSLIVFNTLNWARTGLVSVDLHDEREIVDQATGQTVPYAVLYRGNHFSHVQFAARQVPPVGYKVYTVKASAVSAAAQAAAKTEHTTSMESPYYRLTLDSTTGAIRSIYDKQLHRELVNQHSPYRFGQYLYVSGGGRATIGGKENQVNSLIEYARAYPAAQLTVHAAAGTGPVSVERTPYGSVAHLKSDAFNTPSIQTEVRLFDDEKKIELIEDVDKKEVFSNEGVYFAFPFAMSQPRFQYEVQNGVVDPAKDMYPGAGHEWFSVQHWVSVEQDGVSATVMPLDTPLVTLGDINRGAWPESFGQRPGTIFSYVMNNYWNTNYRGGQGGKFRFNYVITSAQTTDPAKLSHVGWEEVTPLELNEVTTQDKAVIRPPSAYTLPESLVDVQDPELLLETWKHAEDGNGTILRFLDLGGKQRTITVKIPLLDIKAAWETDAVERDKKQLQLAGKNGFTFTANPHGIVTVRLLGK